MRLLEDLRIDVPRARRVRDMIVVGPTQRRVARIGREDGVEGFAFSDGRCIRADVVVGADGATSRVAEAAGLAEPRRALWGFGTTPARGRVLLVGDAAGLVNPLQGEGIAQAMGSGRAAAEAILAGPAQAAARYRRSLAATYAPYQSLAGPIHEHLRSRPIAMAHIGRVLTAPGVGRTFAGAWSLFWNDLLTGAQGPPSRRLAAIAFALGQIATSRGSTNEWFVRSVAARDTTKVASSTPVSMS